MIIQKQYSKELRDALLTAYFTGHESGAAIAKRFGVNPGTVSVWITRYKNQYIQLRPHPTNNPIFEEELQNTANMPKEKPSRAELELRINQLEEQLEEERMRSTCLDKMIEIAERDLKISIRKKSGAKQSKK